MKTRFVVNLMLVVLTVFGSVLVALAQGSDRVVKAQGYLSVDAVRPGDKFKVAVALHVADGYHINAHAPSLDYLIPTSVVFEAPGGFRIGEPVYPQPVLRSFEFEPATKLAVHEGEVIITADGEADRSVGPGTAVVQATVEVQSCNESQCLAPARLKVEIPVKVAAAGQAIAQVNSDIFSKAAATNNAPASLVQFGGSQRKDSIADSIAKQGILITLLAVFLSGLALNTTPCVYPIIPITIGFFANQGAANSGQGSTPRLGRTFARATAYVLGMAITYSILGVVASMTGNLFGAVLQKPFVLIGLAALMVGLALSMFGVYEFRLPDFLNRFATAGAQSTSGITGALVMGLTMGIVAAPCIGPFVLALLVHIGAKGDPLYGFFMFFVLALGLGMPYLVLGTFSGALKRLPRSGEWMITVRKVFGLVLIGMALYFLMPLMGSYTTIVFIGFFAVSALYLILWESGRARPRNFAWVLRTIGARAAVVAVAMAIPKSTRTDAEVAWQPYSQRDLATARSVGKPVIIDVFADWCIPCKELDKLTFTDPAVRSEAERFVTLKLDLTRSDEKSEAGAAKERFDIRGVPTVIFLDTAGRELKDVRLEGFEKPNRFLERMKQVESSPAGSADNDEAKPIPQLTVKLLDGKTLDLKTTRGKVVLIDFWATWCLPCLSEIPTFNGLHKDYRDRGLEIIAISLDEEGASAVKPFVKAHQMNYRVALGDLKLAEMFGVTESIPVTVVIDKQGRIRWTHVGVTEREKFETEIKQLLQESQL